ncbi:MAG: RNA-binding S4 domain-containing protein [Pelotomaculum sp.]|uniref:RQC P-site tRNA stabilizing factor n=1 Tax=Pelotomaculum thermopropionicum (strain DSM 13744 / JCM 10971 / SI) TaxID=370438 RepID=A5D642_PELTS|nr:RNA-binding S4 domain-containing protein [Pelotomaculum sp.]BAF58303.1 ribosome-associated heat shock protein [Pelotomaculum thermopropionicum SI]
MRLDKFLKVSRVIKRRTLAKEVCDRGQVEVNGRPAKAGTEIKPGDVLAINFGHRLLRLEILSVQENVPAKLAAELYRVVEDRVT